MLRKNRTLIILLQIILVLLLLTSSCNKKNQDAGGLSDADIAGMDFETLKEKSKGSEVSFYMWGGSTQINTWVRDYAGSEMEKRYGITLKAVPINDAAELVSKLLTEKQAGKKRGSADLIWINGENFKNAREADLLFGPFTQKLPNYEKHALKKASEYDFGYPVEGYESPYGMAQFVFEYDSAVTFSVPADFAELEKWVFDNRGLFTYPQPPDFTGSAFIRQAFYGVTGGYEQYMNGFDESLFNEKAPLLWDYLNRIEPYLWQEGKTYPKNIAVLEGLFQRGEVSFSMFYSPSHAAGKIAEGSYPASARTFVMNNLSLSNTHFTAIPFNAPNKAGAMITSDFLLSFDAQLSKADPVNWGDLPVLDFSKLTDGQRKSFADIRRGEAVLSPLVLSDNAVPEIPSGYLELLEKGWDENVLKK
ncbi:MAG: ABC transporter substrate-binding protein [Spirochaetia bacterium]|jgi:putative spermidine/putrescine transport system substrate-binding protein|nr:ABC transporter substrate-binding protein [Spirochaetia bacterium]